MIATRQGTSSKGPMSARRTLLRGAAVLFVLFGARAATAIARFADLAGAGIHWPAIPVNTAAPGTVAAGVWLLRLHHRPGHPKRAAWAAAFLSLTGAALLPYRTGTAEAAAIVALTIAGTWLCTVVSSDATAGQTRQPPGRGRRGTWDVQAFVIAGVTLAAHTATGALSGLLAGLPPANDADQATAMHMHSGAQFATTAVMAGVREEIPMVALLAVLMTAARRPVWQTYLLACVIRVIPHLYSGTAALGVIAFAAVSLWLYRRSGRIIPIIAGHTLYNLVAAYGGTYGPWAITAISVPAISLWILRPHVMTTPAPTPPPPVQQKRSQKRDAHIR